MEVEDLVHVVQGRGVLLLLVVVIVVIIIVILVPRQLTLLLLSPRQAKEQNFRVRPGPIGETARETVDATSVPLRLRDQAKPCERHGSYRLSVAAATSQGVDYSPPASF
jgi:hypothetical protein